MSRRQRSKRARRSSRGRRNPRCVDLPAEACRSGTSPTRWRGGRMRMRHRTRSPRPSPAPSSPRRGCERGHAAIMHHGRGDRRARAGGAATSSRAAAAHDSVSICGFDRCTVSSADRAPSIDYDARGEGIDAPQPPAQGGWPELAERRTPLASNASVRRASACRRQAVAAARGSARSSRPRALPLRQRVLRRCARRVCEMSLPQSCRGLLSCSVRALRVRRRPMARSRRGLEHEAADRHGDSEQ